MKDVGKEKNLGSNKTEAVLDAERYEEGTHVHIPHEEAINDAKDWVDENEK
jgi:hypothetical protein